MMIKITERCTMGCPHCMNNALPDGKDMSIDVFKKSLEFMRDNGLGAHIIITGGEPTEHNNFNEIMTTLFDFQREFKCFTFVTITTNGEMILKDSKRFLGYVMGAKECDILLTFQVSADVRYYPRRIETHKRIFREDGFVLCDDCVEQIYPQGRALENGYKWVAKASKCFNVRALSKQINNCKLSDIERTLAAGFKFCTPHIKVDGGIGLGESDLCPSCASIFDNSDEIIEKIRNFKCSKCDHINKSLDPIYQSFL